MFTFGIRYLTRIVVATDVADRRRAEWPPHPARVFMALAAAHFQTGDDPEERAALEWLEKQPAPLIHAPAHVERAVVTHYVPVNDKTGPAKAPLQSAQGLTRNRQPRIFARAWIEDDAAYLTWPEAQPSGHFDALSALCAKVTRIGHSASLVQMWASQDEPSAIPNWVPNETRATERFRVPGNGSLSYLERQFNRDAVNEFLELSERADDGSNKKAQKAAEHSLKEKFQNTRPVRLRPEIALSSGYAPREERAATPVAGTVFDHRLLVFPLRRADGPFRHLDLIATLQLTGRFREAVLKHLGPSTPEVLTGHRGGRPAESPHVAYLPLPFVGREHAHGGIMGVALALPRELNASDRQMLLKALAAVRDEGGIKLGALGKWELPARDPSTPPVTLRDRVWTAYPAGSLQWATVTPYVYDRHAKAKDKVAYQQEIATAVRISWQRIRHADAADISVQVLITPVSAHLGAPASHEYPRLTRKNGSECRHTHAILIFDRPIIGPLLLGAGRYRGYGLCRPIDATEED
jgi:CRISPR-associated protein Csb2